MLFLIVAYLERSDYLIRSRHYNVINIALPIVLAGILFTFRTVIGAAAIFAFATALVFTTTRVIGRTKRIMFIAWGVLAAATLAGGTIMNETEGIWEQRESNVMSKRSHQVRKGYDYVVKTKKKKQRGVGEIGL